MSKMLSPIGIRKLIRKQLSDVKGQMISEHQVMLLNYVERAAPVTSSGLAEWYDISVQSASTRLLTLYRRGYLIRDESISSTGGVEYIYDVET